MPKRPAAPPPEEGDDDAAYADAPIGPKEFSSEDESLGWDAERWEEFSGVVVTKRLDLVYAD